MQQLLLAKYSNFEQMINSDYGFLLWLVDTFTFIDIDEYYKCVTVNMIQKPLKTLYPLLLFYSTLYVPTNNHHISICIVYCRLACLMGHLKLYWFSTVHYWISFMIPMHLRQFRRIGMHTEHCRASCMLPTH